MHIKRKKINSKIIIIFSIFLSIFFIYLNTNKKLIRKEFFYIIDILDSKLEKVTTFAELFNHKNVYDMGETYLDIFQTVFMNFPSFLKKIPDYYFSDRYQFENLSLNFNFNNYKKLLEDRLLSIKSNIGIVDRNEVGGSLKIENEIYKVDSSVKGKLIDHFRSPHRFSLKLTMKDNKYFFGMREFSIQKPESRASPYEQIFLEIAKNLDFVIPKHKFFKVNFNGKNWGVMNVEENPSKETLELQKFTGELIFQFGNEKNKFLEKQYFSTPPMDSVINLDTFPIKFLDSKRLQENKFHTSILKREKFKQNIYDYFDNEKMCTLAILSIIWGSSHVLELNNTQYAYDIYSRKISPIPQDVASSVRMITDIEDISPVTRLYFNSCSKVENKKNILNKIKFAIQKSQNKLNLLQLQFPMNRKLNTEVLYKNINFLEININNFLKIVNDRLPIKKEIYNEEILKKINIFNVHVINKENVSYLNIGNLLKSDIYLKNLILYYHRGNAILNKKIDVNKKVRGIYFQDFKEYLNKNKDTKISIPLSILKSNSEINKIHFDVKIDNIDFEFTLSNKIPKLNDEVKINNDNSYKFIKKLDENLFLWKKGIWTINNPIFLDKDLIINEGTEINFINESYLYLEGKIKILGKEDNKVKIYSSDNSWKGMHINSNDIKNSSIINHAEISELNAYIDDKFKMNGGINFYKSDVKINNLKINKVYAEDAINLINSSFSINNLIIENALSDALDADFSKGVIKNSIFKNISGDAIDTSGSKVLISNTSFNNIQDKAISAGEKSNVRLLNLSFKQCLICIVSKDDSRVDIEGFDVENYSLYFAASFKKKNFYENGGILNFINSKKNNLKSLKIVRDNQSKIYLNDNNMNTEINNNFRYFYENKVFN